MAFFRFQIFRDITLVAVEHLKTDKASFSGIAMGTDTSTEGALKQPAFVARLILVGPALQNLSIVKSIAENLVQGGIEWAESQLNLLGWFRKLGSNNSSSAISIKGLFTRPQAFQSAVILKHLSSDDPFKPLSVMAKIKQPTAVLSNDEDLLHPSCIAEKVAKLIPNARCTKQPSLYKQSEEHQSPQTQHYQCISSVRPRPAQQICA